MADRFWSISAGQEKVAVAETASTTAGAHVEVRITYDNAAFGAQAGGKQAALRALQYVTQRIIEDTWPPV
jgi:hypothetical protein